MATRNKYRQQYLRWHSTYEKRATKELRTVFKKWVKNVDWDNLQAGSYTFVLNNSFDIKELERAYFNIYYNIGVVHGKRVGKGINLSLKSFIPDVFISLFERNVREWLRTFGAVKIKTVRQSFFEYIVELISNQLENRQDMRTIAKEIQKEVNRPDFYRWQAERIARTESTGASNYAALQAGEASGFEMVKEWISATDKRTRKKPQDEYDHLEMNGKTIDLKEKFGFNNGDDLLDYPADPTGEAGNIINCRCTIAVIAKRDKNGMLIPKI